MNDLKYIKNVPVAKQTDMKSSISKKKTDLRTIEPREGQKRRIEHKKY
jgi:hypothetical protein